MYLALRIQPLVHRQQAVALAAKNDTATYICTPPQDAVFNPNCAGDRTANAAEPPIVLERVLLLPFTVHSWAVMFDLQGWARPCDLSLARALYENKQVAF